MQAQQAEEIAEIHPPQDVRESSSRTGAWAAILCVAITGNLTIALGPIYWGGFSAYAHFSDALIGTIMSAEYFGATLATIGGLLYMHRAATNLRKLTYCALAVYAIGNYLTPDFLNDPPLLEAVRFICGLSSGTTFLAAAAAATAHQDAKRLIPIFYSTPYLTGFLLQPVLPRIFAGLGFGVSFKLVASLVVASMLLHSFFPRYGERRTIVDDGGTSRRQSWAALILIGVALLLQYVANSGLWLFFERIGVVSGHSEQTAANFVGLGTGMALVGTALSTALAKRLNSLHAILAGTCVMGISTFMLHFSGNLPVYVGSVTVFNLMITFVTSFYFILLDDVFHSVRAVVVGNIALMLGYSLSPLLIGYTVSGDSFAVSINATIGLFLLSLVVIIAFALVSKRSQELRPPSC
jgi:hypothetical protein